MSKIEFEFYDAIIQYLPRIARALERIANELDTEEDDG